MTKKSPIIGGNGRIGRNFYSFIQTKQYKIIVADIKKNKISENKYYI